MRIKRGSTAIANPVTFIAATNNTAASASSMVLNVPSGVQVNDLLVAVVSSAPSPGAIPSAPAGWVRVDSEGNTVVFSRIATASEPSSYTFIVPSTRNISGGMVAFRGCDIVPPHTTPSYAFNGSSSTSIVSPSVSAVAGDMLVSIATNYDSVTGLSATPPPGMTERIDSSSVAAFCALATQPVLVTGTTGTRTWTSSSACINRYGISFVVTASLKVSPKSFPYWGAAIPFVVPDSVTTLHFDILAGAGEAGYVGAAGPGARLQADLAVTPGETIMVRTGGFNLVSSLGGGGVGSIGTPKGGMASDIRQGGDALSNRKLVAGGGGSGGNASGSGAGGNGGGTTGQAGGNGTNPDSCWAGSPGTGGGGGTSSAGGAGGAGGSGFSNGVAGSLGQGGAATDYYAGSGGGGYYGGGSGGTGAYDPGDTYNPGCATGSGGGGGGSSYAGSGTSNVTHTAGYNSSTNGSITISW